MNWGKQVRATRSVLAVSLALAVGFVTLGLVTVDGTPSSSDALSRGDSTAADSTAADSTAADSTAADSTAVDWPAGRALDSLAAHPPASAERSTIVEKITRTSVFGPDLAIAVTNLSITPGQYFVGYSYESRLESAYRPGTLRCGLVDSNGVDHFILEDPIEVKSGAGWSRHEGMTTFALGDVTLGIRCDPQTVGLYQATFRDISLWVVRMPYGA